ncbi:Hypothetical predicted protein [Paramuricea clavata]|uniref:Uncharacterized protein n=1 Tax=Paramuricea clavata TaxID=317549 RepID=A0A6S7FVW1_PARCT|nr:Hypothetical predicted protein [Paramuricea clavata]
MAFKYHDEAAARLYDKNCTTILKDGSKCQQLHCKHAQDAGVCEAGDDEEQFNDRFCSACRMDIYWYLREKTEEMHLEKVTKAQTESKDYFIATGYHSSAGWQYEHVTTRKLFDDPEAPDTEEIIASVGARWVEREKNKKPGEKIQTTLTNFFPMK